MNASRPIDPRPFVRLRCALGAALLLAGLLACAEDAADSTISEPPDDTGPSPDLDLGPPQADAEPPDCDRLVDGVCLDTIDVRCAFVGGLVDERICTDEDGDCAVGECPGRPALLDLIGDCDDRRVDVNPFVDEQCDDIDHDCDGDPLDGYAIGVDCAGCGRIGKTECAVDDPFGTRCSVYAGQSDPPEPSVEETCNGADDDCDQRVDEGCRLAGGDGARLDTPALCDDGRLVLVEAGALVRYTPAALGAPLREELRPAEVGARWPTCGAAGLAWIEAGPDANCPDDGLPRRCVGAVWARPEGGPPAVLTPGGGAFGPPVIGGDRVFWHSVIEGRPRVVWAPLDASAGGRGVREDLSDPTRPGADGLLAVREWNDRAAGITRFDPDVEGTFPPMVSDRQFGQPGPPARSDAWIAWSAGDAAAVLYVLRADDSYGFRPVTHPGPQVAPRLVGDRLVWLDAGTRPPTLRRFDLDTGEAQIVAVGPIPADGFAASAAGVAWIERRPDGDVLLRRGWAPVEPEPEPMPDGGPPDAEPADAEIPDAEQPDAEVDAEPADAEIPDAEPADAGLDMQP